jgi:predicted glycoside hydrolase/deacetylase ChbG (UPF0249 family)
MGRRDHAGPAPRRLIVNADDFGLSPSVNAALISPRAREQVGNTGTDLIRYRDLK